MKEQQPVLMVEGEFLPDSELEMVQEGEEITFWIDTQGEAYDKPVTVHYLCTQDQAVILAGQGSSPITPKAVGSYLVFEMDSPGTFRLAQEAEGGSVIPLAAAAAALCLLIMGIWICRKKKARRSI